MKMLRALSSLFAILCLPALLAAQTGVTLLVRTDMSCNWKLDGQPMGLLTADFPKIVLVAAGQHLIVASATVGAATVRFKVEAAKVEKTVSIQLRGQDRQVASLQQLGKPEAPEAAQNATWADPTTGLVWTSKDNGSDVDWVQATDYCSKLQLAGSATWRLPTNEELQGIYDPTPTTRTQVDHGVKYELHVKGGLNITGGQWSSTGRAHIGQPAEAAWTFRFGGKLDSHADDSSPSLNFVHFSYKMRALCVRQPENDVPAQ